MMHFTEYILPRQPPKPALFQLLQILLRSADMTPNSLTNHWKVEINGTLARPQRWIHVQVHTLEQTVSSRRVLQGPLLQGTSKYCVHVHMSPYTS